MRLRRSPQQRVADRRATLAIDDLEHQARLNRQQREHEARLERDRLDQQASMQAATLTQRAKARRRDAIAESWSARRTTLRATGRNAVLVFTNAGVTLTAMAGQGITLVAWAGAPIAFAIVGAVIIELVSVYIAWHRHVALVEGDSSWRLALASYAVGGVVAWFAYSHVPVLPELFAICSAISPWLWSLHSRHVNRVRLRAAGLLEPRTVRLSGWRWLMHPIETPRAFRIAVGDGIQDPTLAIATLRAQSARSDMAEALTSVVDTYAAALDLAVRVTVAESAHIVESVDHADADAEAAIERARADTAAFVNRFRPLVPALVGNLAFTGAPAADSRTRLNGTLVDRESADQDTPEPPDSRERRHPTDSDATRRLSPQKSINEQPDRTSEKRRPARSTHQGDPPRPPARRKQKKSARRSIDEHRADLQAAIAEGRIDPGSPPKAEVIRRALGCGSDTARQLRNELNTDTTN